MLESSQIAMKAASLAVTADYIDEEIVRILLALNDADFACRLFSEAVAQGKSIAPGAWKSMCNTTPPQTLPARMFDAFVTALRERNDRGAQQLAFFLAKLVQEKDAGNRLITEALNHNCLKIAVWIMLRPMVNVDRLSLYRWLKHNTDQALDLAGELEKQLELSKATNGKKGYLDSLASDIRSIVKDNEDLRNLLGHGTSDEIADILYSSLLVTAESLEALERFAWDRPECIPRLAELIQNDANDIVKDGATQALGNFFRALARTLTQNAEAAKIAARARA